MDNKENIENNEDINNENLDINNPIDEQPSDEEINLQKLKEAFIKIINKYNLKDEKVAQEIANYLTKDRHNKITHTGFAKKFKMSETEAKIVLSFVIKGIEFKEKHIDSKNK